LDHELQLSPALKLVSVYFGGGTPSLAQAETLGEVVASLSSRNLVESDCEIALEANPKKDCTYAKLKEFYDIGINRLSIGVQALNDDDLKYLGRDHSTEEAVNAIEIAKSLFPRVSFDLIYGRHPQQTQEQWEKELKKALSFGIGHISLYTLTIEPQTNFYHRFHSKESKEKLFLPGDIQMEHLLQTTLQVTKEFGFTQYECSNFCKEGHQSKHNNHYWNYGDYIGIGPGAAGRLQKEDKRYSFKQILKPSEWMKHVESNGHGTLERIELNSMERMEELFICGLRKVEGLSRKTFMSQTQGKDMEEVLEISALKELIESGHIILDEKGVRATPKGLVVLDSILLAIFSSMKEILN